MDGNLGQRVARHQGNGGTAATLAGGVRLRRVISVAEGLPDVRRLAWPVIAAVTGVVAASFIGSTWYLAEKIRSEALAVAPGPAMPAFDDVQFAALQPGKAQLRAIGDQPALFRQGLCAIAWLGGMGQPGPMAAVSGGLVTRPLTVISGPAPRAGQLAALDASCFLGDPAAALGIPMQDVVVPGPLSRSPTATTSAPLATHRATTGTARQNGATSRRRCDGLSPGAPGALSWPASPWAAAWSRRSLDTRRLPRR